MKGRKPIPTTIKLLNASRKDRINHKEPKPTPGVPVPPHVLDELGMQAWNQIIGLGNWLTPADAIVAWCLADSLSQLWQAEPDKRQKYRVEVVKHCAQLGFDPTSRTRIQMPGADGPKDELAEYIA